VWSNVVTAEIKASTVFAELEHSGQLSGDVLALFVVAAVQLLTPGGAEAKPTKSGLMAGQWTHWKRNQKRISEISDLVRKL